MKKSKISYIFYKMDDDESNNRLIEHELLCCLYWKLIVLIYLFPGNFTGSQFPIYSMRGTLILSVMLRESLYENIWSLSKIQHDARDTILRNKEDKEDNI